MGRARAPRDGRSWGSRRRSFRPREAAQGAAGRSDEGCVLSLTKNEIERSAVRPRYRPHLLEDTRDVSDRPVFDDLAIADAMDGDTLGFDVLVRRRDPEELPRVYAPAHDVAHNEVILRD